MGIDHSDLVVTTVAVAVVVTLTFQATTKRWLARRLNLLEDSEYVGPRPALAAPNLRLGGVGLSIRAKLYAALAVTVVGLVVTAGVGIAGMSRLGDRFDDVQEASRAQALALQLKFDVTDFNGWQTAYGYDNGQSRPIFLSSVARYRADFAEAPPPADASSGADLSRPGGTRLQRFHETRRPGIRCPTGR